MKNNGIQNEKTSAKSKKMVIQSADKLPIQSKKQQLLPPKLPKQMLKTVIKTSKTVKKPITVKTLETPKTSKTPKASKTSSSSKTSKRPSKNTESLRIQKLKKLLYPKSVAVIGASNKKNSVGNEIMLRLKTFGFNGKIYPVNLKEKQIENLPCFASVENIKKPVDLAIIAVPAHLVLNVIDQCHAAKISAIVVISSGFKEVGGVGAELEQQLLDKIKQNQMIMVGPNCLGIINSASKTMLNASFAPLNPVAGKIGFASQSGALGSGIINILPQIGLGLGQFVSLGNGSDVSALDLLEVWENDANINLIMLYIESIKNLQKFRETCARVSLTKPIVIIKSGRGAVGARATASHTGSLAGDDVATSAVLASSGVIREFYLRDFVTTARALSSCKPPQGENLAILTNAGGPGILAADAAEDLGIKLATLTQQTKQKLKQFLPPQASINNPLDVVASADLQQISKAAATLLSCEEVDLLLVIYLYITAQNDVPLTMELENLKKKYPNKPIVAMYMTSSDFEARLQAQRNADFSGKNLENKAQSCLNIKSWQTQPIQNIQHTQTQTQVPIFNYEVDAIHALKRLLDRKKFLEDQKIPTKNLQLSQQQIQQIAEILNKACENNIKTLSTFDSLQVFKILGLPMAEYNVATNYSQAKMLAQKIGYPITIKISSDSISHKTDIGGVVTNIQNEKELKQQWKNLLSRLKQNNLQDQVKSFVIMQQIKGSSRELVAGVATKENAGKLAMFGIGGIFIETLKEVAFRPLPLSSADANSLIFGTKAAKLMGDVRGNGAADICKMQEILLRLSALIEAFPKIVELDANPIMIDKTGNIFMVDARIVIEI